MMMKCGVFTHATPHLVLLMKEDVLCVYRLFVLFVFYVYDYDCVVWCEKKHMRKPLPRHTPCCHHNPGRCTKHDLQIS